MKEQFLIQILESNGKPKPWIGAAGWRVEDDVFGTE
jgi:hypothetical protein